MLVDLFRAFLWWLIIFLCNHESIKIAEVLFLGEHYPCYQFIHKYSPIITLWRFCTCFKVTINLMLRYQIIEPTTNCQNKALIVLFAYLPAWATSLSELYSRYLTFVLRTLVKGYSTDRSIFLGKIVLSQTLCLPIDFQIIWLFRVVVWGATISLPVCNLFGANSNLAALREILWNNFKEETWVVSEKALSILQK